MKRHPIQISLPKEGYSVAVTDASFGGHWTSPSDTTWRAEPEPPKPAEDALTAMAERLAEIGGRRRERSARLGLAPKRKRTRRSR